MTISATDIVVLVCSKTPLLYLLTQKTAQKFGYVLGINECIALSFTEKFNGMNLIFLFWLALLLFPMFESFEGFGISIKKRKYDKEKEAITSDFHAQILNAQIKKEQERKEAEHE